MLLEVFSVYDTASRVHTPYMSPNFDVFLREVLFRIFENGKSSLAKYPEQFQIFRVAKFDDSTGAYQPMKCYDALGLLDSFRPECVSSEIGESDE